MNLVENFQGFYFKKPKDITEARIFYEYSLFMPTPQHIFYIGSVHFGFITIYLVACHHLGGYLCLSQETTLVWLPNKTLIWIINNLIQAKLEERAQTLSMILYLILALKAILSE